MVIFLYIYCAYVRILRCKLETTLRNYDNDINNENCLFDTT